MSNLADFIRDSRPIYSPSRLVYHPAIAIEVVATYAIQLPRNPLRDDDSEGMNKKRSSENSLYIFAIFPALNTDYEDERVDYIYMKHFQLNISDVEILNISCVFYIFHMLIFYVFLFIIDC